MKNPILRSMLWSAACLLLTVSASSAKSPERTSGYVGIRPLPRSAGESKIDWMSGIGYYDSLLRPDDFTAKYTDVIKDYRGAFATRKCFFEHYLPLDRDWIDMNPETNPLILKIRSREKIGMEVEHILICREAELLGRGEWGPFKEDSRILYQRDVDDYRKLFKLAYKQGLTKHKNYKLIQMVTHASAFMEIPEAVKIVKTMDGIAYESHQFNRHWPYETGWTRPEQLVKGARWTLDQGLEYIFYYGSVRLQGVRPVHGFHRARLAVPVLERGTPETPSEHALLPQRISPCAWSQAAGRTGVGPALLSGHAQMADSGNQGRQSANRFLKHKKRTGKGKTALFPFPVPLS